jgi:hypothetical protein
MLMALVSSEVAAVIGLDAAHQPGPEQGLKEFGVDSLMAVELRNRLALCLATARKLTATMIFDYPTVTAIASYLASEILGYASSPPRMTVSAPAVKRTRVAAEIQDMAEDEAEARLLEKLDRL